MDLDFWHERWERGEAGFHQNVLNPYLGYFYGEKGPAIENRANLRVFVPLCGKTMDMHWLIQSGYAVIGVECSGLAIEQFFVAHDLEYNKTEISGIARFVSLDDTMSRSKLEIYQADFFQLTRSEIGKITDVFDRASLIALPQDMRVSYAAKMAELQDAGTRTLLVTLTYPQHEMDGPPFSVSEEEVHQLYGKDFKIDKLLTRNILKDEPRFQERGLTLLVETAYKLTRK